MKPLPAHLPPLPENAVYLGTGGEFKATPASFLGYSFVVGNSWYPMAEYRGTGKGIHYAAPKDSPIAILNGLGEPEVDWKKRAEEWEAVADEFVLCLKNGDAYFKVMDAYEALKSKEKP